MSKAQNFRPIMKDLEGDFQHLAVTGSTRIAWQSQDLNPAGVATFVKGRALHVTR
jgi:hypothetical protein